MRPWLLFKLPKMKRGDAARIASLTEQTGIPMVPWQRDLLDRMESASLAEQHSDDPT